MRIPRAFRKPGSPELDRELQFHIERLIEEKMAQGLTAEIARREAILEFGGTAAIKEELFDVHRIPLLDFLLTHLRFAFRSLRAAPTFSLTVIATLTLGIGANTAVFSAIDAVLLRPLPYPDSDRLFVLQEYRPKQKSPVNPVAPARLEDWNRLSGSFQAISGYYTEDTTTTNAGYHAGDGNGAADLPVKIKRALVAPRFLQVLGISPALGHDFMSADEHTQSDTPSNVLISQHFWREHFNSNPNVIGKHLIPGKSSATVIGVMPAGFSFPPEGVELWYVVSPDAPYARDRRSTWYTGIGRLRPGVTESQARANLDLVQSQLARRFPQTDAGLSVKIQQLKETTVGTARASLWLLFGAVSLLLLIACTNVSALVLGRGMERRREFSIRSSLGAARFTLMVQVLMETLLLALCGTAAGMAVAAAAARVLSGMAHSIPRIGEVSLDWRLFLYTAGCSVFVTLLSGLFPAVRASRAAPAGALSQGGRTHDPGRRLSQWMLVAVQVSLAICLLSGAGLLLRSFRALSQVSPGFDAGHVLAFRLTGGYGETADAPRLRQGVARTLDALRAMPGVQAAASSWSLPGVPSGFPLELDTPDAALDRARPITAESRAVTDGYFATMAIPILGGKPCDRHSDGAVVVNRSFVSTYFNGTDPVGLHLVVHRNTFGMPPSTILGVAADAREAGIDREPVPTVYWCGSVLDPDRAYLLRAAGDPASLINAVRRTVHAVEPARAVYDLAPLASHIGVAFAEQRLRTLLLSLFAATALALACVGLYGAMTYFVTARRREIGVRIALGAHRGRVGTRFVAQGLAVTAAGAVAGLCVAAGCARFLSGMLYNVRANDAATLGAAVAIMLFVALLASAIPAIRALRADPMRVLREE